MLPTTKDNNVIMSHVTRRSFRWSVGRENVNGKGNQVWEVCKNKQCHARGFDLGSPLGNTKGSSAKRLQFDDKDDDDGQTGLTPKQSIDR